MIIQITGVTSGTSPYDVFLCDTGYTSCFLISGSCQIPPTVVINTDYFFPRDCSEQFEILKIYETKLSFPIYIVSL